MSTVKRRSSGNLRRRGWDLLNVHREASKWWGFTKCPPWHVDLNGGDLLNSTVNRQSGGDLRRRGGDLLNIHPEKYLVKNLILTQTATHRNATLDSNSSSCYECSENYKRPNHQPTLIHVHYNYTDEYVGGLPTTLMISFINWKHLTQMLCTGG